MKGPKLWESGTQFYWSCTQTQMSCFGMPYQQKKAGKGYVAGISDDPSHINYRTTLFLGLAAENAFLIFCACFIVQLEIKSWLITGENLSIELVKTEKGNATVALSHLEELQNISASSHRTVRPLEGSTSDWLHVYIYNTFVLHLQHTGSSSKIQCKIIYSHFNITLTVFML